MKELRVIYRKIRERVARRLEIFENIGKSGTDEEIFTELVFCLLTPQSRARQAEKAIHVLSEKNYLFSGTPSALSKVLNIVRFRNNKAKYIVEARDTCGENGKINIRALLEKYSDAFGKRRWLAENIKGMGYKEASHFLRNIGFGGNLAILDRHVLRNLKRFGFIDKDDIAVTPNKYLELEIILKRFSKKIGIPMDYLDFVLWYRETQDIFK